MPRKKKEDIPNISNVDFSSQEIPSQVKVSPEEMSQLMYNYTMGINSQLNKIYSANPDNSSFNPMLSQDFMQTFDTGIKVATPQQITEWLKNPKQYSRNLREYGQYLLSSIQQYKRIVNHFVAMLTMQYEWIPFSDFKEVNKNKKSKDEFLEATAKTHDTLKRLRIKQQYPKIVQKTFEDGVAFYYVKKTKDFITLYPLPTEYCYIQSQFDLGYRFALDLNCFDVVANLKESLPELYKQYEIFCKMRDLKALTDLQLQQMQYVLMPVDMGYVFTYDMIHTDLTPPLKGAFKDTIEVGTYKNLLRQKLFLDTCQLLVQKIPQNKNGNGELIMDAQEAQKLVQATAWLLPQGVKTISTPFDPESFSFASSQQNQQLIGIGEQMLNSSVGVSGSMLGDKTNSALALNFALEGNFGFIEHIYRQLEDFTNLMISNRKYPSKVKFFGNRYKDRDDLKQYQTLVQSVNAPLSKMYALLGYEPFEVSPLIEYENLIKLKDKSKPIISGSQMSSKDVNNKGGRNEKDLSDLGDSGAITKEYNSNKEAMKS